MAKMGVIYDKDIKERVFALFSDMVSSPSSISFEGNSIVKNGVATRIIATLRDGLTLFAGETLTYQLKHGNTVLESGTKTTDNNGQISIDYTGTALGKIDVVLNYKSLTSTYEIWDTLYNKTNGALGHEYSTYLSRTTSTVTSTDTETTVSCAFTGNANYIYYGDAITGASTFEIYFKLQRDTPQASNSIYVGFFDVTNPVTNRRYIFAPQNYDLNEYLMRYDNGEFSVKYRKVGTSNWTTVQMYSLGVIDTPALGILLFSDVAMTKGFIISDVKVYKPYIDPTPNTISLTGSTDIVTTGETSTLTARVKNSDGYSLNGMQVKFYENNVLKDTVTTANGKAEYTYTGTASGLMNIKAECGSLQETFVIRDGIVYDTCLDATKYTGWNNLNNRLTVTYDSDGRLLSNNSSGIGAYTLNAPDTSQTGLYDYDWQYPYCIEFDVTALSNFTIQIQDANSHQGEVQFPSVNNAHIRFEVTASSLNAFVDGTAKTPVSVSFDDLTTIVFIVSRNASLKFKDLVVYPL